MSYEEEDTCMWQDLFKPLLQGFALLRSQAIHAAAELFENCVVVLGLHEPWPHENEQEEAERLISVRSPACARGREHEKNRERARSGKQARAPRPCKCRNASVESQSLTGMQQAQRTHGPAHAGTHPEPKPGMTAPLKSCSKEDATTSVRVLSVSSPCAFTIARGVRERMSVV